MSAAAINFFGPDLSNESFPHGQLGLYLAEAGQAWIDYCTTANADSKIAGVVTRLQALGADRDAASIGTTFTYTDRDRIDLSETRLPVVYVNIQVVGASFFEASTYSIRCRLTNNVFVSMPKRSDARTQIARITTLLAILMARPTHYGEAFSPSGTAYWATHYANLRDEGGYQPVMTDILEIPADDGISMTMNQAVSMEFYRREDL